MLRFCLLFVLLSTFGAMALGDSDKPIVRKTDHFVVYGWSSGYLLVERAAVRAEITYSDLSRELGLKHSPPKRVAICVYRNRQEFSLATGTGRRSMLLGQAAYGIEVIDVDGSELFRSMEEVLDHEIAHILVGRVLGPAVGSLPLWMNEGIAVHFSTAEDAMTIEMLSNAVAEDKLIPLESLSQAFRGAKTSGLAYAESGSIVGFMESEYGQGTVRAILRGIAEGGAFGEVVRKATGVSAAEIYSAWEKITYRRYGLGRWARQLPEAIWGAMALMVIAAFMAMMRKKRRLAKQYEEEEFFARKWPPF